MAPPLHYPAPRPRPARRRHRRRLHERRIVQAPARPPAHRQDLILGFIARLRPAGWADSLIFDSLREGPTENVTDHLRRRLSDVVWTIDRRAADGNVRTIQVLIEHQSSVDHSMPMRFLNYGSLMYQRKYRDRRWRKGDTADQVLHVVLYNGATRWDAPQSLAELVPTSLEHDGPAQLALSYDVVDLVALAAEDLPRPNLITWMAEVERSRRAGELAERVRELGQWLAAEDEPELTKSFDLWLGALGEKWGVELPSIRDYKETSAMLLEKIDRWEAKLRQEGRLETIEGFLQAGVKWPVIQSATGIDEPTYRTLKRDAANGTEQTAPRQ